ncbi:hypothetical protein [Microbacterium sp. CFBP9034]|uniref:hypothetical protein n=1 Tax=Microbacterium sp. CFBP9034 TaxID=3096540 RepID=UPI002A6B83E8|nr:hypothetical protein [Microbacterium sp. CFBP9034]MDY0909164.1 hypothetical protein [Microbacterium sp. CFBP9034]
MDLNVDPLSEREHSEMRDVVLAGSQRIRPAGARRAQVIAGAVALVLVGGITGGAITTAALLGDEAAPPVATPTETAETPTPVPSATPTATPTPRPTATEPAPPVVPAEGIVPFGGECENATTEAEIAAVAGMPMMLSDYRWQTGAESALGGIDCLWVSSEEYLGAQASVFAYPADVVTSAVKDAVVPGCRPVEWDAGKVECAASGEVDGTWLVVRTTGASGTGTPAAIDALYAQVAARVQDYPAPVAATRSAQWWTMPDCAALEERIDPAILGFTRVEHTRATDADVGVNPYDIPWIAGVQATCFFHFTWADGTPGGVEPQLSFFAGGAIDFDTALARPEAVPVTVDGAVSAVIVPGNDRYEGSWGVLLVNDGVNVLAIYGDGMFPEEDLIPLAEVVLAQM